MALIGYARCSTDTQVTDAQIDALTAAGCKEIFRDEGISGRSASRPELDKCLRYLREGDTLVVTKLDRLGRSLRNLIDLINQLGERKIDLRVIDQGLDTSTPGGKLVFHVMAAVSEFEVDLLRERTRAGLAAARARGRKGGRVHKLSAGQAETLRRMYDATGGDGKARFTVPEIAEATGVHKTTVYRYLREMQDGPARRARS